MSILIVDDEFEIRNGLESLLNGAGYKQIISVGTGKEALDILGITKAKKNTFDVDLILLDIGLPDINGKDVCTSILENNGNGSIPIIAVSGFPREEVLDEAYKAGVSDFISKPLNNTELLARVRTALKFKNEIDIFKAREKELQQINNRLQVTNKLLKQNSLQDSLTGIANRRRFEEDFQKEWRRAVRYSTPLAIIMADIDCFKDYNDTYGHRLGDQSLIQVARALSASVKRPGDLVARYGGEEFIVVLPVTELQGACHVAETMRLAVEKLKITHRNTAVDSDYITLSLGVSAFVPDVMSAPQSLVDNADRALYKAKNNGRNKVVPYE